MRRVLVLLILAGVVLGSAWAASGYYGPGLLSLLSGNTAPTGLPRTENTTAGTQTVSVSVLISFENKTGRWFNDTIVPVTYSFYNVTYAITGGDMVARWDRVLSSSYVFKIFGQGCEPPNPADCRGYWSLWLWNDNDQCWAYSHLGIDLVKVSDVRMITWHFTNFESPTEPEGHC